MAVEEGELMVMRALMEREARRLSRWWLLGMVLMLLAWLREISRINHGAERVLFLGEGSQLVSVVGFALAGIGLGIAQAWPDALGGRWVAYVHAPVSRARLFVSKSVVGVAAVLSVTAGSTLLMALLVSMPGRLGAPFEASMLGVPLADAATAIVYYFAALGAMFRPGRWLGTRLLPLGFAVMTSLLVLSAPYVGAALAAALLAAVVAAAAAWASFRVCDSGWSLPPGLRALQGLHLAAGLLLAVLFAAGLMDWAFNLSFMEREPSAQAYYRIRDDGRVIIAQPDASGEWVHRDLQGAEVEVDSRRRDDRAWREDIDADGRATKPRHYRDHGKWLMRVSPRNGEARGRWYYSRSQRRLLRYHHDSPALLGSWALADAGLAGELIWSDGGGLFATRSVVYRFDFKAQQLKEVFRSPKGEIVAAGEVFRLVDHEALRRLLIWENAQLHIIDVQGNTQRLSMAQLPSETRYVSLHRLIDGHMLIWGRPGWDAHQASMVLRYDDAGRAVPQALPALPVEPKVAPRLQLPLALVLPPSMPLLQEGWQRWLLEPPDPMAFDTPLAIVMALMALLGLLACYGLARRQRLPFTAQISWALLGAVLGLIGPLLFRCMHTPPAMLRCSRCRRRYLVVSGDCSHCGRSEQAPRPSILSEPIAPPSLAVPADP